MLNDSFPGRNSFFSHSKSYNLVKVEMMQFSERFSNTVTPTTLWRRRTWVYDWNQPLGNVVAWNWREGFGLFTSHSNALTPYHPSHVTAPTSEWMYFDERSTAWSGIGVWWAFDLSFRYVCFDEIFTTLETWVESHKRDIFLGVVLFFRRCFALVLKYPL